MSYIVVALSGVFAGFMAVYILINSKRSALDSQKQEQEFAAADHAQKAANFRQFEVEKMEMIRRFEAEKAAFDRNTIQFKELQNENHMVKRDLQNVDIHIRKLELDRNLLDEKQRVIEERTQEIGSRYLKDSAKWILQSLGTNNFASCKQKLIDVIERCKSIGLSISEQEESVLIQDLKKDFERQVRRAIEREEQARIKAQIREEAKLQREIDTELKRLERERQVAEAALKQALSRTQDEQSAEILELKARLADAEQRSQRAMSRAQLTKAGHVYVISNVGSFGEGVFKVGMTRRLEPSDRIKELGDASVPFPFDVHMVISSDNAPALENAIHRKLYKHKINKINPRKEFFKIDLIEIVNIVKTHHGEVEYLADAEALEFRQSLTVSEDDVQFIEHVYNTAEDDGQTEDEDAFV